MLILIKLNSLGLLPEAKIIFITSITTSIHNRLSLRGILEDKNTITKYTKVNSNIIKFSRVFPLNILINIYTLLVCVSIVLSFVLVLDYEQNNCYNTFCLKKLVSIQYHNIHSVSLIYLYSLAVVFNEKIFTICFT